MVLLLDGCLSKQTLLFGEGNKKNQLWLLAGQALISVGKNLNNVLVGVFFVNLVIHNLFNQLIHLKLAKNIPKGNDNIMYVPCR